VVARVFWLIGDLLLMMSFKAENILPTEHVSVPKVLDLELSKTPIDAY